MSKHGADGAPQIIVPWRPDRLNMLTDGVFAIVMTLLVLELKLPEAMTPAAAMAHLDTFLPKVMAYVIGFSVAGSGWAYVHHVNSLYGRSNLLHVALNLVALMFISLVPFCASVMGSYPDTPYGPGAYALGVGLASTVYTADLILTHKDLISPAIDRRLVRSIILGTSIGSAWCFFVALVIAPRSPLLALGALALHFCHHWIWLIATEKRVHAAAMLAETWDAPHERRLRSA